MILNRSFKEFKFRHRNKQNQIIYTSKKVKNDYEIVSVYSSKDIQKIKKLLIRYAN